ncbi:hypothetical protein DOTSEDRAFT_70230, partial [Dothistroma septosporum NZE10]
MNQQAPQELRTTRENLHSTASPSWQATNMALIASNTPYSPICCTASSLTKLKPARRPSLLGTEPSLQVAIVSAPSKLPQVSAGVAGNLIKVWVLRRPLHSRSSNVWTPMTNSDVSDIKPVYRSRSV